MQPTPEELMAEVDAVAEVDAGLALEGAPGSGAALGAEPELEYAAAARASDGSSTPVSVGSDVGITTHRLGSPTAAVADDRRAATAAHSAQYELAAAEAEAPAAKTKVWTQKKRPCACMQTPPCPARRTLARVV